MQEDNQEDNRLMAQAAPYPQVLYDLVIKLRYRKGWLFSLRHSDRGQGSEGLTLDITILCADTYAPDRNIRIQHSMIVPAACYNERSWRRWLLDQILLVERHETCEFFRFDDGTEHGYRPFAPNHGPGFDPYQIFEEGTLQEKRTSYLGEERDTDAPNPR